VIKFGERRGTPADFLVIGLGNPGKQYDRTRHNVGVEVVQELCSRSSVALAASKFKALTAEVRIDDQLVVLAFPTTYMNESGQAGAALCKRYGIEDAEQIIVVHDELDLPPGTVRVKQGGGLAGNNGLRSLKAHLHTDAFLRVRLGIGKPPSKEQGASHVLKPFGKADRELIDVAVQRSADAVEQIVRDGVDATMTAVNAIKP
jgi:peptidyl-tRNA hydrolase, PTH1 family